MTHQRIGVLLLVLSLAGLLGLPMAAHAQDPLTQTYTAENGALTFNYPGNWLIDQAGPEIFITNTEHAMSTGNPSQLLPGEFLMDILVDPDLMSTFGVLPSSPPADYYDILATILVSNFGATDPGVPVTTTFNGRNAVRGEATGASGDTFLMAFELERGIIGAAFAYSPQGELAAFMPTIEAILATVTYDPPLSLKFTSTDGAMTFNYPVGWMVLQADYTQAVILNTKDVVGVPQFTPGMMRATAFSPSLFTDQYGLPLDAPVEDGINAFLDFLYQRRPGEYDFGAPQVLGGGGLAGATGGVTEWRSSTNSYDAVIWAKQLEDYGTIGLFFSVGPGGLPDFEPIMRQIFESMAYVPPPPPVVNGSVVWQYQQPVSYTGDQAFGAVGGMTITADDTLVIADGPNGLQLFSPDGQPLGIIKSPDIVFAFDVAVDADGNYWVTDSAAHKVVQLDPQGNTLQSFGEIGDAPGMFGENTDSPSLIEFGPDGNLFIYVKFLTGDNQEAAGYIQIWSTDGQFLGEFSTQPPSLEVFPSPVDMDFKPDGSLIMVNSEGVIRTFYDTGDVSSQTDFRLISAANSITVAPNGDVYVGALGGTVYHFSPDLQYIEQFGSPQPALPTFPSTDPYESGDFTAPTSIGVLSNGDVVVTDTNFTYSQIVRITFGSNPAPANPADDADGAGGAGGTGGSGLGGTGNGGTNN
ncbi:MAG: hypothetical protein BroJett018_49280 [Chloroflexota bacterium]|nr:MAG: hypothetical protein BroJett018_49280 [Chloroflexota bacterium]